MLPKCYLSLCHYDLKTPDGGVLHKNLHLDFYEGQTLLIKGSNGSGKTTLIYALAKMFEKSNMTIELLPQLMNLKSSLPVNLGDVLEMATKKNTKERSLKEEILSLGLLDERQLTLGWNTASGGEKRRTLLTRCLLMRPDILILDEPFNHLDSQSVETISSSLSKLMKEKTLKGLVIVSHPVYLKHPSFDGLIVNEVSL